MKKQIDRVLPNNLEMEESLITALLIDNSGFGHTEELTPDDFYKPAHGIIFSVMTALFVEKQPVDLVTVGQRLIATDQAKLIGGIGHLSMMVDCAAIAANVKAYAKGIKGLSTVRKAILSCMSIIDEGYKTVDPEEFVSKAQEYILSLKTTSTKDDFVSMDSLVTDAIGRIKAAQADPKMGGLNFGFPVLNNAMHITGSKLIIIAARPSMGKTALMLSISKHLALQGVKSTILSLEMDKEALTDRYLSDEADVNSLCFYAKNGLSAASFAEIESACSRLSYLQIDIDDSGCKIEDVVRKCRVAKKRGSQIIFIDQLSKIQYPPKLTEYQGFTQNCNRIADLKKELRIPIVLLCQIGRKVEERVNKRPTLSDLKATGAIEEDADMVFFLYRGGDYDKIENPYASPDQGSTEINLAKNRNGATGVETKVTFNAKRGMFVMGV